MKKTILVVSDGTGRTAERVVGAALAQFPDQGVELMLLGNIQTAEQVREAVEKATALQGMIAYTFVETKLRSEVVSLANEAGIRTVDIMGPLLAALSDLFTAKPAGEPGIFTQPGEEHNRILQAIGFAVAHDDGGCSHELRSADIVLVGPSRTSKTPLGVYLAFTRVLKVANVPLSLGMEPLEGLKALPPRRVVGLTMNAEVLSRIRIEKWVQMERPAIQYHDVDHVRRELRHCHEIYRRPPAWPVVDVTGRAIEEIAAEICSVTGGD